MSAPRLVMVHRRTELRELLDRHVTLDAVEFFLSERSASLVPVQSADQALRRAEDLVAAATPSTWRFASVERADLSRFLFEADDLIVVVGQDGLVPNVSKYLSGQPVFGVFGERPGLLCSHDAKLVSRLIEGSLNVRKAPRAMVSARLDDGQELTALNEIYLGDRGHQSARYVLRVGDEIERQSSSGIIVGTGTGATGWIASLWGQVRPGFELPAPESQDLAYFVRESWPSPTTGVGLVAGELGRGQCLRLTAESSLVVFGDGLERDQLRIDWGQTVELRRSNQELNLLVA